MAIVTTDNKNYKDIANKIREKNGTSDLIFPADMPKAIDEVARKAEETGYEEGYQFGNSDGYSHGYGEGYANGESIGKQSEYDAFWDAYQQNGNRTDYSGAFSGIGWNDNTLKPKYNIVPKYSGVANMFRNTGIVNLTELLNNSGVILDISQLTSANLMFYDATSIKSIPPLKANLKMTFASTFVGCSSLEDIIIEGTIGKDIDFQYSKKLTRASIESIMGHLTFDDDGVVRNIHLPLEAVDREFAYTETDGSEVKGSDSPEWMILIPPSVIWDVALI